MDSDFAGDLHSQKSSLGYIMSFASGAVAWQSILQKCVSLSTTEAWFINATKTMEMLWMRRLTIELCLKQKKYVVCGCDNKSAIYLAKKSSFRSRTKYIDTRYQWI